MIRIVNPCGKLRDEDENRHDICQILYTSLFRTRIVTIGCAAQLVHQEDYD